MMADANNQFLKAIEARFVDMQRYNNVDTQTKARNLIPVIRLEQKALLRMRSIQKDIKTGKIEDINISIQELLLLELLSWFKESFFQWVDSPECDFCDSETKFSHMSTDPNVLIDTNRVEMHQCTVCKKLTAFARYNNLDILLETREGRCGEWATVFTLMCLAMGWDARFICDETDHVWTEVYSLAQRRWLHCDPCENICDNPLIYETGWNKQLSYVMAYSPYDVQDVTWRYSANHTAVRSRRRKCAESDLMWTMFQLRERGQHTFTSAHKMFLTKRILMELVELMFEKKPTDADKQGRISGALDWRGQRRELLTAATIFSPTKHELSLGQMTIRYSIVNDQYEHVLADGKVAAIISKWSSGVFKTNNVIRKEENDWQMVYLCRAERSPEADIEWKYQMIGYTKKIDLVTVKFNTTTYENGEIDIRLSSGNQTVRIPGNGEPMTTAAFNGMEFVVLKVVLRGGRGDCAFQHTQLFRESMRDKSFPFSITITFQ